MRSLLARVFALVLVSGVARPASAQQQASQTGPASLLSAMFHQEPQHGKLPELSGVGPWLNSKPLSTTALRGHVVLIDLWAYDCPGCLQSIAGVKALDAKYRSRGLVVIAVQPPVAGFKTDLERMEQTVRDSGMTYPVVFDTSNVISRAFNNNMYPAQFLIDKQGNVRNRGSSGQAIETLLAEKDSAAVRSK